MLESSDKPMILTNWQAASLVRSQEFRPGPAGGGGKSTAVYGMTEPPVTSFIRLYWFTDHYCNQLADPQGPFLSRLCFSISLAPLFPTLSPPGPLIANQRFR